MAGFHLVHCFPHPRMHGLRGYHEVMQTIAWGLIELGYEVTFAQNQFASDRTNIVFGAQIIPVESLTTLPSNTLVYNLEQLRGLENQSRPTMEYIASHFSVWEYSKANLSYWKHLGSRDITLVPIGYAPILTRISKAPVQDIDVLIYGITNADRLNVFNALSRSGLTTVFVSGLYAEARDDLISRSKIVLNIHGYARSKIFEMVRVSYLLANKKAVVANLDADTYIDPEFQNVIKFTSLDEMRSVCVNLVDDEAARVQLEEAGYNEMIKHDIRAILRKVPHLSGGSTNT